MNNEAHIVYIIMIAIVLIVGIISSSIVYKEYHESELETCLEACDKNLDSHEEFPCMKICMEKIIAKECKMIINYN